MSVKVETKLRSANGGRESIRRYHGERQEGVASEGEISNGVAVVFVVESTAAITAMEFELGLVKDFPEMLERIAPKKGVGYEHQRR